MFEIVTVSIFALIGGFIGASITELVMSRRKYKYKWKCPVCKNFSVDASSRDIVDRVRAIHTH